MKSTTEPESTALAQLMAPDCMRQHERMSNKKNNAMDLESNRNETLSARFNVDERLGGEGLGASH
jgi:hypothetical protein